MSPPTYAASQLQGKRRVHILCVMRGGPVRLGQLSRLLPEASKKFLMTELKQLVASGLVERLDLSDGGVVRHGIQRHRIHQTSYLSSPGATGAMGAGSGAVQRFASTNRKSAKRFSNEKREKRSFQVN